MYKIAIIEDEPIMRRYLSRCLDWGKLNLELCGVYADKEDALIGIKENIPNIILTDIKLPDSDGLSLMTDVMKINSEILFIVISAYSDFEIVKKSFKIGAIDYILKTEFDPKNLENILVKMVQRLDSLKKEENNKFKVFLEKEYLLKKLLWDNGVSFKDNEIKWRIEADSMGWSICVAKLLNYKDISKDWNSEKELLKYGIYNVVEELLNEMKNGEFFFNSYDEIIFLFDGKHNIIDNDIQNIIDILCNEFNFVISSAIVKTSKEKSLADEYSKCVSIADYSFIIGRNSVIREDELNNLTEDFDVINYTLAFENKFKEYDFDSLYALLDELGQLRPKLEKIRTVQDYFYACLIVLFRYAQEQRIEFIDYDDIYGYVVCSDMNGIIEYIRKAINRFENVGIEKSKDVEKVEKYILENYDKDIKLKTVAEKFCFEYSYFSKMFVKNTGKTFKQYLTDIRLQKAYKLILNSNHSMSEIAQMVGYQSYDNFSRTFVQKYGKRPIEIRKENNNE